MADEGDDWFGGGDDDAPPEIKPIGKKGKAEEAPPPAETAPTAEEAQEEAPAEEPKPEAEDEYLDPDKLLLFKHWIRPKFLPYKYLTIYRKNYYDDVIDYLDKKSRGVLRDIPRAQTWAERILRTFSDKVMQHNFYTSRIKKDLDFVENTKLSQKFYYYHVKNQFNKQFSPLLY